MYIYIYLFWNSVYIHTSFFKEKKKQVFKKNPSKEKINQHTFRPTTTLEGWNLNHTSGHRWRNMTKPRGRWRLCWWKMAWLKLSDSVKTQFVERLGRVGSWQPKGGGNFFEPRMAAKQRSERAYTTPKFNHRRTDTNQNISISVALREIPKFLDVFFVGDIFYGLYPGKAHSRMES